jgi:peptidoglycan/xylan/chitin deacetylase (PgdA/CDA1 family)
MINIPRVFPVLMYHQFPDDFESHLDYLSKLGYRLVHLNDVADYFVRPMETEFPEKTLVLTFDDGCQDFFSRATPLLAVNDCRGKATICISTNYVSEDGNHRKLWGDIPAMTWDELSRLKQEGYEIVSHSASHVNLDEIKDDPERLRCEIDSSKMTLTNHLDLGVEDVRFFCFPYGAGWRLQDDKDQKVNDILRQAGYVGALRVDYLPGEPWDQFCIPRYGVSTLAELKALLEKGFSC